MQPTVSNLRQVNCSALVARKARFVEEGDSTSKMSKNLGIETNLSKEMKYNVW